MSESNDPIREMQQKAQEVARYIDVAKKLSALLVAELSLPTEMVAAINKDLDEMPNRIGDFKKLGRWQNPTHSYMAYIEKTLETGEAGRMYPDTFLSFYGEFLMRFPTELSK